MSLKISEKTTTEYLVVDGDDTLSGPYQEASRSTAVEELWFERRYNYHPDAQLVERITKVRTEQFAIAP